MHYVSLIQGSYHLLDIFQVFHEIPRQVVELFNELSDLPKMI